MTRFTAQQLTEKMEQILSAKVRDAMNNPDRPSWRDYRDISINQRKHARASFPEAWDGLTYSQVMRGLELLEETGRVVKTGRGRRSTWTWQSNEDMEMTRRAAEERARKQAARKILAEQLTAAGIPATADYRTGDHRISVSVAELELALSAKGVIRGVTGQMIDQRLAEEKTA